MAKKNKFLDFDQFWAEASSDETDRPRVRVFGEEVILPASPPAMIVLRYIRQSVDPDAKVEPEFIVKMAEALFGEHLNRWLEKGLTLDQLVDLVTKTVRMYMRADDEEDDETEEGEGGEGNPRTGKAAGGEKS